jgi:type I restriction enzyme S subunit
MKSGNGITVEEIEDDAEYPVYGGNGFRGFTNKYTHDGEFVLIGRQGALCGNINYVYGKFWASEHAVVATPSKPVAALWLGELLRIMNLNQYSISAAQPGLAIDRIKELVLPVPPLPEQKTIADFLDRETAKIDTLVSEVETAIEKLKEYRTALISAAVTGKIDVREAV